jgi:hypothetical protein
MRLRMREAIHLVYLVYIQCHNGGVVNYESTGITSFLMHVIYEEVYVYCAPLNARSGFWNVHVFLCMYVRLTSS